MNQEFNIDIYLDQFNILKKDGDIIDCDEESTKLYKAVINGFKIEFTNNEYQTVYEFRERVFDFVENLRELDIQTISLVLTALNKKNIYLVDLVILLWCSPRSGLSFSKAVFNRKLKQNVSKYNHKLSALINLECVKNFCIETLVKTNSVPVHCIDYLWYYMNSMEIEFIFYNSNAGPYIDFKINDEENFTELGFNMEYLLRMGLGNITYNDDPMNKGSFKNFLKNFVMNIDIVKRILEADTSRNYLSQLVKISQNPANYFDETLTSFPPEIMNEISNKV